MARAWKFTQPLDVLDRLEDGNISPMSACGLLDGYVESSSSLIGHLRLLSVSIIIRHTGLPWRWGDDDQHPLGNSAIMRVGRKETRHGRLGDHLVVSFYTGASHYFKFRHVDGETWRRQQTLRYEDTPREVFETDRFSEGLHWLDTVLSPGGGYDGTS